MNRIKIFLIAIITGGLLLSSCEKLEDVNKNPNNPVEVSMPSLLLAQILSASFANFDIMWEYAGGLAQQKARPSYNGEDRYDIGSISAVFSSAYRAFLNLHSLQNTAIDLNNSGMLGAAQLLEAHRLQLLTDCYGDVPYSEAAQYDFETGDILIKKPVYDTQEAIYGSIIALLQAANTNLAAGIAAGDDVSTGDGMFGGDLELWQKLANSMLLRVYIRMSTVVPGAATSGITTILGNSTTYPIMTSEADNADVGYTTDEIGINELYLNQESAPNDHGPSSTYVDYLVSMNDQRLAVQIDTISDGSTVGYPISILNSTVERSYFSSMYIGVEGQDRHQMIMSYAEVQLILAEAALELGTAGSAQTYYENAVTADFTDLGIADSAAVYLGVGAPGEWPLTAAAQLEIVYREKWVSTFLENMEGWCLVRRVGSLGGLVNVVPEPDVIYVPGSGIPTHLGCPVSERDYNTDNFDVAVLRQGLSDQTQYNWGTMYWIP